MKKSTIVLSVLVLLALPVGCGLYSTYSSVVTAPSRVINKTLGTDNIIQNYEWFEQQYADIKAMDVRLSAQREAQVDLRARASDNFEDRQEAARLGTVIAGLQGQRASMVAEYNARSRMMNREVFKAKDLPTHID